MIPDEPLGEEGGAHGVDWDAVRHDFLYSGMSQRRIAWKHGATAGTLRKYMRDGGWERQIRQVNTPRCHARVCPLFKRREGLMAIQLTPPTKNVFYLSIICAVVAIVLYILGVLGVIGGGFMAVAHIAFWIGMLGWALLMAGVAMKGV
jgi:small-conductance mechanosensitive channel